MTLLITTLNMSLKEKKTDTLNTTCVPVTNIFQLNNKYYGINATIVRGNIQINRF